MCYHLGRILPFAEGVQGRTINFELGTTGAEIGQGFTDSLLHPTEDSLYAGPFNDSLVHFNNTLD